MELFGYSIKRNEKEPVSFAPKQTDDGAVTISAGGGAYGTYVDLDGTVRNEAELINKYRDMADYPEVDMAVDDIVNEMVVQDYDEKLVELVLDDLKWSPKIEKVITEEFDNILDLLEFNSMSYDIARRWYVDGRLYYHAIIDPVNNKNGIVEMRYIDPRKIRKIREIKKRSGAATLPDSQTASEYFLYNEKSFTSGPAVTQSQSSTQGVKIAADSIVYCPSGLVSRNGDMVLSYLQKAIRPLNNLRSMEDSLIIYRIARAPERRIFYVDTGSLPPRKAEEYVKSLMIKFKNKLIYDSNTGEIKDDRKNSTMLEDFWLPRREGGKGTEITTLPGGQSLGQLDDVLYFQQKLFKSLNVPIGRLDSEQTFSFGQGDTISRDEVKFDKFITKLRGKFSNLFTETLGRQLVLKGIMSAEDWAKAKNRIKYKFAKDNYYAELKDSAVLKDRLTTLQMAQPFIGTVFSWEWAKRHIMRQTDEEMEEINKQLETERKDENLFPPDLDRQAQQQQLDMNAAGMQNGMGVEDQGQQPQDESPIPVKSQGSNAPPPEVRQAQKEDEQKKKAQDNKK